MTPDDTCTRSMRVPAATGMSPRELREYAKTAPEMPYRHPPRRRDVVALVACICAPWVAILAALIALHRCAP